MISILIALLLVGMLGSLGWMLVTGLLNGTNSKTAKIVTRKIVQPDRDTKVINTTTRNITGQAKPGRRRAR